MEGTHGSHITWLGRVEGEGTADELVVGDTPSTDVEQAMAGVSTGGMRRYNRHSRGLTMSFGSMHVDSR